MNLAIDCRHETGIGTVVKNLIPHFDRHDAVSRLYLIGEPEVIASWTHHLKKATVVPLEAGLYSVKEQIKFPKSMLREIDLLYVPHYNVPVKWFLSNTPCVITIHDLAHFSKYLQLNLLQKAYAHTFFRLAIRLAKTIVTDSDFSKGQLIDRFSMAKAKTVCILLAVNHDAFFPDTAPIEDSPTVAVIGRTPFILTAASVRPHKNLNTLLKSFESLKRDHQVPHKLVIVGKKDGYKIKSNLYEPDPAVERDIFYTGFISDELLRKMYSQASCFVYPSFYEGFGFPPLEAMACGAPVVCSKAASLPEVVGDAAMLCDPTDVAAFADSIHSVISQPVLNADLRKRSIDRAGLFSWPHVAEQYLRIFQSAIA